MAEVLLARPGLARPGAHGVAAAIAADEAPSAPSIREDAFPAQVNLRVDSRHRALVLEAIGVELAPSTDAVTEAPGLVCLGLGPDEWLIVGAAGEELWLESTLRVALGGVPASVVDVSANRTVIEVAGAGAEDLLSTCSLLDFHPRAFPAGACRQSTVADADAIIHKADGSPTFRLHVRPSFALHVTRWLLDARKAGD